jgi:hypothetical protein
MLQRWTNLAGPAFAAAARRDWEQQWRSLASHSSPELQQLATMLFDTGQQYLELLGSVSARASGNASSTATSAPPPTSAPRSEANRPSSEGEGQGTSAPFADVLQAWSKGLLGGGAETTRSPANMAKFAEFLGQLPALAHGRGFREAMHDLATAEGELQRLVKEMSVALTAAQAESLQLLETRLKERAASGQTIDSYRALYDVWVECSELAYSTLAHSEAFGKQQAALSGASVRVRVQQQRLLDLVLKHFDLPTRAEVNTLHRQIRDLSERLARVEGAGGAGAKPRAAATAKRVRPSKAAPKTT